jgi:hypothetical protein
MISMFLCSQVADYEEFKLTILKHLDSSLKKVSKQGIIIVKSTNMLLKRIQLKDIFVLTPLISVYILR